jgi:Cof subfamily protein (haloacid dehalogenase superfamily)
MPTETRHAPILLPDYPHPIKLVVCDLDGTLVQPDLLVNDTILDTIQCLHQVGVKVVIATGRMFPSALPYVKRLGLDTPVICYQGAVVRDTIDDYALRYENPVPLPLAREIVAHCQEQGIHINVYINDVLHSQPHELYVDEYKRTSSIEPVILENVLDVLHTDAPPKMVIINNHPEVLERMRQELLARYGASQIGVCKSRHNFLELTAPDVNKWSAVVALAGQWGIAPQEVMCLGDEENDVAMLAGEGLGLAMGNAPLAVQQKAKGIVPSIFDDGAVLAMKHYILDKTP